MVDTSCGDNASDENMSLPFEGLDYRPTPIGMLSLRRQREFALGVAVFEIELGTAQAVLKDERSGSLAIVEMPDALHDELSTGFYRCEGLRSLARHLKPGGVFGLWSNDRPDARTSLSAPA